MGSMAGKNSLQKSLLSTEDVCRILKSSEESGILKLKFRDLEFERETGRKVPQPIPQTHSEYAIPEETHKKQNEQQLLVDELRTKAEQLQELIITDPYQFEKMLADGELVPDEDTDDGDRDE